MDKPSRRYGLWIAVAFTPLFISLALGAPPAPAPSRESVFHQAQDGFGDLKTFTKKSARELKKKTRDAFGKESATKDRRDEMNDARDEKMNETAKARRHARDGGE